MEYETEVPYAKMTKAEVLQEHLAVFKYALAMERLMEIPDRESVVGKPYYPHYSLRHLARTLLYGAGGFTLVAVLMGLLTLLGRPASGAMVSEVSGAFVAGCVFAGMALACALMVAALSLLLWNLSKRAVVREERWDQEVIELAQTIVLAPYGGLYPIHEMQRVEYLLNQIPEAVRSAQYREVREWIDEYFNDVRFIRYLYSRSYEAYERQLDSLEMTLDVLIIVSEGHEDGSEEKVSAMKLQKRFIARMREIGAQVRARKPGAPTAPMSAPDGV